MESMSGCYLPNSATLDNWQAPLLSPISHSFFDNSSQESKLLNGCIPLGASDLLIPESSTPVDLNMNSFSFSPVDIDPMPNMFSFNSCSSPYKEYTPFKDSRNHDSDVFLSLKHTIVHPTPQVRAATPVGSSASQFGGQLSPLSTHAHYNQSIAFGPGLCPQTPSNMVPPNISYNTYPQIQVSATNNNGPNGIFYAGDLGNTHHTPVSQSHTIPPSVFPAAMSVNLSMNMTMGVPNFGEQFAATTPQHQVQWTAAAPQYATTTPTPVQGYSQPVQVSYNPPSPNYASGGTPGTYTFTAEFRPVENISVPPIEREFSGCSTTLKPTASAFYPCKQSSRSPTSETAENHHNNQNATMLRPRSRIIPTGRAACFPANAAPESPLVDASEGADSPSTVLMDCDPTNEKSNLCRICGKTYARPSTLKTHMRTHSGERPYQCGTCDKSFSQAANLTAHLRTHSGEKPFRCPICDRRFSQSSSVTTHMRTHSGERPYRCYMCKKAFSDSSTLTKHLRIHSGEKPYQCKVCLLRFSQSGNLNRHMRVHTTAA